VLVFAGVLTILITAVLAERLNHLGDAAGVDQEALQGLVELRDGLRLEEVGYWQRTAAGETAVPDTTRRNLAAAIATADRTAGRDSDNAEAMRLGARLRTALVRIRDAIPPPGQEAPIGTPEFLRDQRDVGIGIIAAETAFQQWIALEQDEIADTRREQESLRSRFVMLLIGAITTMTIVGLALWLLLERARRRLTASLDRRRAAQTALLSALQDGLVSARSDGTIRDVNNAFCAMTGFARDELIDSAPPFAYWPQREHTRISAIADQAVSGSGGEYDLTFQRRDGELFPVIANVSPLLDEHGQPNGYVGTFKEVTERRLAEAARIREEATAEGLRRAVEARDAERAHLARELHDDTAHGLAIMGIQIDMLAAHVDDADGRAVLEDLRESVHTTLAGVRALATELRPPTLREYGLNAAIERQAMRLREIAGTEVAVDLAELPENLNEELQVTLFRVAHEALANVARHSGARTAAVSVDQSDDRLRLTITDDGRGFDPAAPTDRLGLAGMRERLDLVGGSLTADSQPGHGTTLVAEVPVRLAPTSPGNGARLGAGSGRPVRADDTRHPARFG
jgi:PAS domain S-box-containing protein